MSTPHHDSGRIAFPSPGLPWQLALTLSERKANGRPTEVDEIRGEKRLDMWRELKSVGAEAKQAANPLAPLGMGSEAELREYLGETRESVMGRTLEEPRWYQQFRRWWTDGVNVDPDDREIVADISMLELARPILEGAVRELRQRITDMLDNVPEADRILSRPDHMVHLLLATLPGGEMLSHIDRTTVLELNVARVEGRLDGHSAEDRFAAFVDMLRDLDASWQIWDEYPVLARLITTELDFWIEACVELTQALIDDVSGLRARGMLSEEVDELKGIEFGAGDKHREGRSVALLTFDHGKLAFKPRPLHMDTAFDGLVAWVNDQDIKHSLRRFGVWDKGGYGWSEFIESGISIDEEGADRYAWRLGALTSLLYVLHATDFHFENVLASGEHPVLVDLESLLHSDKSSAVLSTADTNYEPVALQALINSVQSIGVIPSRFLMKDDEGLFGLDVSALGGGGGQVTPMAIPVWEGEGTDNMRLVNKHMEMDDELNQPIDADGKPYDLLVRVDHFADGFNACYQILHDAKDELLAQGGPLAAFADTASRLIARPTHVYARLLLESTHPDFLRDGLDRDRSLARVLSGHQQMECRIAMLRNEIAEMHRGDVPVFHTEADSGAIRAGMDSQPIGYGPDVPFAEIEARVAGLDENDRAFQEWVIRSSVAATTMSDEGATWPNWSRKRSERRYSAQQAAEAAKDIADRLDHLAIRQGDRIGWIGLGLIEEKYWQLQAASLDSYIGYAGIAHAIDAVSAVTDDERLANLAHQTYRELTEHVSHFSTGMLEIAREKERPEPPGIGAYTGIGGAMYVLAHATARHGNPEYAHAAASLLPVMEMYIDDDILIDVISGAAGAIFSLLALETVTNDGAALRLAQRCADRLLATKKEMESGWGWITPINPNVPLAGFSHGNSGIITAFARLHEVAPNPAYVEAIEQALAYEKSLFDPHTGNWPDLREGNVGASADMRAWCHGAPGVTIARGELLRTGVVSHLTEELELDRQRGVLASLETGLTQDPVSGIGNHSLCHGDVGNLLIASDYVNPESEPEVADLLGRVWDTLIADGSQNGWLSGVPHGIETPGLLTGTSGIAWGLARLARPDLVPDILRLEAPRTHEPEGSV
ncbi:type 2 lanthipeptide synthetase LanM family protein [Natronoglycomyces albus]|uniref:Type 2 lantipeptide synthetase LanM family protein n=1 Tax=Natronoglycomyces albus TaxID=2811108 RepID=A0A895XHD4_9ACTN|nr:type 2 lanthipeptide synthetase LanM family protein [Natronoglycomyces albus]QSB05251.1 type 2 lantipeptide synthetase LanM family protein [Natronoglycomyces albus]